MKRALTCLFTVLTIMAPIATAHAGAHIRHSARAIFLLGEGSGVRKAIFVDATRIDGAFDGLFSIVRGTCRAGDIPASCRVSNGGAIRGELAEGDILEIDPDLGRAHLKVTRRGTTHELTWEAVSSPSPVVQGLQCDLPEASAIGFARNATVRGNVLGMKVRTATEPDEVGQLVALAFSC